MIKAETMLQESGGGGGGSYSTQVEPVHDTRQTTLQPIADSPGGPTGGDYSGNQANRIKEDPEFTEKKEPTAAGDGTTSAGYSTPLVLSVLVVIMIIFNFAMKRG